MSQPAPSRFPTSPLLLLTLMALLLVIGAGGALVLSWQPDLHPGLLLGGLIALGLIPPLWAATRILRALAANKPRPAPITVSLLLLWNLALVAAPPLLAPATLAEALRAHGAWWTLNTEIPGVQSLLTAAADRLSPAAPLPSPAAPDLGESATEEAPTGPLSAQEIYARAADSVVVVRVQMPADPKMLALLGERAPKDLWTDGLGSGFVIGSDGLIVTNYHVISGAQRAQVERRGGLPPLDVQVVAKLPEHDLALLQVGAVGWTPLALAEREAAVGETAYAIGSPEGLESTLTQGIVSARRSLEGTGFLQMQTPTAPGSSGGPLLDERGQVLGVPTAQRGAGLGLAVEGTHVRALLALPRTPEPLAPYVPGPRLASLDVRGLTLTPVSRMNLSAVGAAVASWVSACTPTLPEGAYLTVPPQADGLLGLLHNPVGVESNLSDNDRSCALAALTPAGLVFTSIVAQEGGDPKTAGLTLHLDRLSAPPEDTRPPEARALTLTLQPPPPPAPELPPAPGP